LAKGEILRLLKWHARCLVPEEKLSDTKTRLRVNPLLKPELTQKKRKNDEEEPYFVRFTLGFK
jgi:hypothetical protein